ncbi:MAG: hypothetical protein Q9160_008419 [Pyrenula sp. 1 TL-2023]
MEDVNAPIHSANITDQSDGSAASTAALTPSYPSDTSKSDLPNPPPTAPLPTSTSQSAENAITAKPTHTLILDASPLLLNQPSISTLRTIAERLITSRSVLAEIRDPDARARVETIYLPFIEVHTPKPESLKTVRDFARKTGDLTVLSHVDIEVLALAYEKEVERNKGDWRLRSNPGQKRLNGKVPGNIGNVGAEMQKNEGEQTASEMTPEETEHGLSDVTHNLQVASLDDTRGQGTAQLEAAESNRPSSPSSLQSLKANTATDIPKEPQNLKEDVTSSGSDSEGWITPSNLKKHKARDEVSASSSKSEPKTLQVATITGDFAMQNVLLQMNLNLLSPTTCKRIQNIRTTALRCHGCFTVEKDMNVQFCPRCGKPTLTRVTSTTNDKGEVKLHLKKNMQWNNRGNVYSIPKPVSGSSNQKWKGPKSGGGKGGWGKSLILAPDQKEYERALAEEKRSKTRNLMDDDVLPGILTGERGPSGGKIRIGAGRNINSRKR